MQMKLRDVTIRYKNLLGISQKKLPSKLSYDISKNLFKLEEEFELIRGKKKELIDTYVVKNEKGEPAVKGDKYDLGENEEVFNAEFEDFLNIETEVDIQVISSELFSKILEALEDSRYDVLTPAEMVALDFMIEKDCTGAKE